MKFLKSFLILSLICNVRVFGNTESHLDLEIDEFLQHFRHVRSPSDTTESPTSETATLTAPTTPSGSNDDREIPEIETLFSKIPPKPTPTGTSKDSSSLSSIIVQKICENRQETLTLKEELLCATLQEELKRKIQFHTQIEEEDDDSAYLPKNYNKQAAPTLSIPVKLENGTTIYKKRPVHCVTYLNIRSVRDIDEAKEEITLDLDVIVIWVDGHIVNTLRQRNLTIGKFSELELNLRPISIKAADKIWIPDLFVEEVVSVGRPIVLDKGGKIILFNPKLGALFIRSRLLATLHCDMNFKHYPADTQKCQIHVRSAAHDSSEVAVRWVRGKAFGAYLQETSDPNFDYQIADIKEFDDAPNLGPETRKARPSSFLWMEIRFRRKMSYHLLQTYLPSVFFLIVTWLCFLIPSKMFEARVGVAMTTLLTQTSMFSSIRETTPVVGYAKAIDIWMVVCILFIFFALGAFTVGAWMRQQRNRLRSIKKDMEEKEHGEGTPNLHRRLRIYNFLVHIIAKYTAFGLSLSFLLFAILYWTWLLNDSEYLVWNVNSTFNDISE